MADGPLRNFANTQVRTDANGYLIVSFPSTGPLIAATASYGWVGVSNAIKLSTTSTAITGPDGGAYLLVNNGLVFINSAMLQFGNSGTADGAMHRLGAASFALGTTTAGDFSGSLKLTTLTINNAAPLLTTSLALTDQSGASTGTLTNAPSIGNPTKWIAINDNGTTRKIPTWT